jgi:hypothetical protein
VAIDLRETLAKQYLAPLDMLHRAIDVCPESLWYSTEYSNRFWHTAYHALFYTHMYLHPTEGDFRPWAKHRENYNFLGPLPVPPYDKPKVDTPYAKEELLEYHQLCRGEVGARLGSLDLETPSGFDWVPLNKLDLQLYNIRHLQHHTGQLIDRLRNVAGIGVPWVGTI